MRPYLVFLRCSRCILTLITCYPIYISYCVLSLRNSNISFMLSKILTKDDGKFLDLMYPLNQAFLSISLPSIIRASFDNLQSNS